MFFYCNLNILINVFWGIWLNVDSQVNIIRISQQLQYFQQYQRRVSALIGPQRTQNLVNKALVLITLGGNDFVNNYFLVPISARSLQYDIPSYCRYLISEYRKILTVIHYQFSLLVEMECVNIDGLMNYCIPEVVWAGSSKSVGDRDGAVRMCSIGTSSTRKKRAMCAGAATRLRHIQPASHPNGAKSQPRARVHRLRRRQCAANAERFHPQPSGLR